MFLVDSIRAPGYCHHWQYTTFWIWLALLSEVKIHKNTSFCYKYISIMWHFTVMLLIKKTELSFWQWLWYKDSKLKEIMLGHSRHSSQPLEGITGLQNIRNCLPNNIRRFESSITMLLEPHISWWLQFFHSLQIRKKKV